jgi:hypothetical protein
MRRPHVRHRCQVFCLTELSAHEHDAVVEVTYTLPNASLTVTLMSSWIPAPTTTPELDPATLSAMSPAEESDVLLSPVYVEGEEPKPGLDGTPVRCK